MANKMSRHFVPDRIYVKKESTVRKIVLWFFCGVAFAIWLYAARDMSRMPTVYRTPGGQIVKIEAAGKIIPVSQWDRVLKGRYDLVWVGPIRNPEPSPMIEQIAPRRSARK